MGNQPFFSIVVTALNAEKTIENTIRSVLDQTFCDYEIIVKDGCSKDHTLQLIPHDKRIRVFVKQDSGIYNGMNQACEEIKGKYVLFLNCGDWLYSCDVLQIVCDRIKQLQHPDVLFGDVYHVARNKIHRQDKKISRYFWYRTTLCHQSVFFKGDCLAKAATYNEDYTIAADFELMLRLYMNGKTFFHVDRVIVNYDGDGISATTAGQAFNRREKKSIIGQYYTVFETGVYFIRKCIDKVRGVAFL